MKTSIMRHNPDEIITCNVCPAACKSFASYPNCDPHNPKVPFHVLDSFNLVIDDFFGQFIKTKTFRKLSRQEVQRYIDRLFILCPECLRKLGNPSHDDYLICSFCNIHWDMLPARMLLPRDHNVTARLRPDGSLYRWNVPFTDQIELDLDKDVPF